LRAYNDIAFAAQSNEVRSALLIGLTESLPAVRHIFLKTPLAICGDGSRHWLDRR